MIRIIERITDYTPMSVKLEMCSRSVDSLEAELDNLKEQYAALQAYCLKVESELFFTSEKLEKTEKLYRESEQQRTRLATEKKVLMNLLQKKGSE